MRTFFEIVGCCFCFSVSMLVFMVTVHEIVAHLKKRHPKKIVLDDFEEVLHEAMESKN